MKLTHPITQMLALMALAIGIIQPSTAPAQGTAFTYQGVLNAGGGPANGLYDLRFRLYLDPLGNNQAGSPVLTNGIPVANGLFIVTLDFGGGIFMGTNYWLEVDVKTNGGAAYTDLSPLQSVTPAPYAIFAENIGAASLASYGNAVTLSNAANQFSGTFIGNGAGLTNANAATLGSLTVSNFWQTSGNIGTSPTNGNFLGTADLQPLEIRVGGLRGWRVEPDPRGDGAANLIGGYISNFVQQPFSGGDFIGGGGYAEGVNIIYSDSSGDFIGAGSANHIGPNVNNDLIGAGGLNTIESPESAIVDGDSSTIYTYAPYSFIGGGLFNDIYGDTNYFGTSVIAGGYTDTIYSNSWNSFIGGGGNNTIGTFVGLTSDHSVIVGGLANVANGTGIFIGGGGTDGSNEGVAPGNQAYANASTIVGGMGNIIEPGSPYSSIGGGVSNTINASYGVIGGGIGNSVGNSVAGNYGVIGGGSGNTVNANYGTIPGGANNTVSGEYSFAAGNQAMAQYTGSFVWADGQAGSFGAAGVDTVNFRCAGGVRFTSNGTGLGDQTVAWKPGDAAWGFSSDRNLKDRFAAVDKSSVLAKISRLPIVEWSYKGYPQRHIGAMAQDFHALFPLNDDDKMLNDADLHGVELAAIQGLNQKLDSGNQRSEERIQKLERENADLKERLEKLEQLLESKK
ncbi:MAG TPA: tail fiber domain-containing protein [Verrucomicrobiae bacterium]|nr:tail fiber domain-containing protein [Verrucomicrobiae bacterium]